MNWNLFLINSWQKINSIKELDDGQLEPTDYCAIFEKYFEQIFKEDKYRNILGKDYAIDYYTDDEKVACKILSLSGENGIYELVELASEHDWQIFDAELGEMIDLENPSNNGYENFQNSL